MLTGALRESTKIFRFNVASNYNYIKYSRYGEQTTTRKYASDELANGCTFILYLKPMHMSRISTQVGLDEKRQDLVKTGSGKLASSIPP